MRTLEEIVDSMEDEVLYGVVNLNSNEEETFTCFDELTEGKNWKLSKNSDPEAFEGMKKIFEAENFKFYKVDSIIYY